MLLYKLNSHACQQFITARENYFAALIAPLHALNASLSCDQEAQISSRVIRKQMVGEHEEELLTVMLSELMRVRSAEHWCEDPFIMTFNAEVSDH